MLKFKVQLLDQCLTESFELDAQSSTKCYMDVARKYWGTKIKIDVVAI